MPNLSCFPTEPRATAHASTTPYTHMHMCMSIGSMHHGKRSHFRALRPFAIHLQLTSLAQSQNPDTRQTTVQPGSFVWLSIGPGVPVPGWELQTRLSLQLCPHRHTCQPRAFAKIYFSRRNMWGTGEPVIQQPFRHARSPAYLARQPAPLPFAAPPCAPRAGPLLC